MLKKIENPFLLLKVHSLSMFPGPEDDPIRTSILVEGMTLGATDVDQLTEIKGLNGDVVGASRQDSEEVLIVVNNSTSIHRKVCIAYVVNGRM
jgi:cobalamin synthase